MGLSLLNKLFVDFKFVWGGLVYKIKQIDSANDEKEIVTLEATAEIDGKDYSFSMTYQEWDIALAEFHDENNERKK